MRLVATLTAALLILPACTSEAAGPAGTYTGQIDMTGMPQEAAAMVGQMITVGDLQLNADSTWGWSMTMMGEEQAVKGTWELDGDVVVMTATEENGNPPEDSTPLRGKYADGTITLEMPNPGGEPMKMILTRK